MEFADVLRRRRMIRTFTTEPLPEGAADRLLKAATRAPSAARGPGVSDGRRVVLPVAEAGRRLLRDKRDARTEQLAGALAAGFTREELDQLMAAAPLLERLAQEI